MCGSMRIPSSGNTVNAETCSSSCMSAAPSASGRYVAGPGKRSPQRNGALKFLVVVVRRIRLSAANGCEGHIHNRVKRRGALFDGVRIDINLERTPHLPQRLRRAIELGVL